MAFSMASTAALSIALGYSFSFYARLRHNHRLNSTFQITLVFYAHLLFMKPLCHTHLLLVHNGKTARVYLAMEVSIDGERTLFHFFNIRN